MNHFNLSENSFVFSVMNIDQFPEINRYNYINKYIYNPWVTFSDKNNDEFKIDIPSSNLNYYNIYDIFDGILVKRENQTENDIKLFNELSFVENENIIDNTSTSLYYIQEKEKIKSIKNRLKYNFLLLLQYKNPLFLLLIQLLLFFTILFL